MDRQERTARIQALSEARNGSTVLAYVTSTREGLEAQMGMDIVPILFKHLKDLPDDPDRHIDLVIHSNGGEGTAPWRIMTLLREYASRVSVLVPHRAFSAATLAALGADEIVMGPMGMLGPTDPTITTPYNPEHPTDPSQRLPVSVEDVVSYIALVKEDVGINHEDELVQAFKVLADEVHPLALGNVKRSNSQGRMMGEKLLRTRQETMSEHDLAELVNSLSSKLYFHGHPINREEARDDLGLHVADADPEVDNLMWDVYEAYNEELKLDEPFNQFLHATDQHALDLPNPPQQVQPGQIAPTIPNVWEDVIGPETLVMVESLDHADRLELKFSSVVTRQWNGATQGNLTLLERSWRTEQADEAEAEDAKG